MEIIGMILIGAFVGWVASIIMGTNAKQGAIAHWYCGWYTRWLDFSSTRL